MTVQIGIIGGSGLYEMAELTDREEKSHDHALRRAVRPVPDRDMGGKRVAFLARHGAGHRLLPSELNFRANIYGFKVLGVERILSASAVGSLKEEYKPLDILIPGSVFRSHQGTHQHVLRTGPRRAHCVRAPAVRRALEDRGRFGAVGGRDAFIAAVPTSTWKGRSSRRSPSRSCTDRGAWT